MRSLPDFQDQESADRYAEIFGKKLNGQYSLVTAVAQKYFGNIEGGVPIEHLGLLVEITKDLMDSTYADWEI